MSNDYKKVFMSNIHKLLTEGEDYSWMEDEDELPPTEYTDDQKEAMQIFDNYLDQLNNGLIARKDFALIASRLLQRLPKFDYLRRNDAKILHKIK